jgi:integral membrane protein (TIGR01906 family)
MISIDNKITRFFTTWFVALITSLLILFSVLRLVMSPIFLTVEYRLPNFPADPYGLTQAERIEFAPLAMGYLFNNEGIAFLGEQTFEDGSPLYDERELSHMVDVKVLVQKGLKVFGALGVLILAYFFWAKNNGWQYQFFLMVATGGKLLIAFISGLLVFIGINFNQVFTEFHHLFFEGDSWLFYFSDTLIRLFPMEFWRDAFILVGVLAIGVSGLIIRIVHKRF